jgi:endoglucanase
MKKFVLAITIYLGWIHASQAQVSPPLHTRGATILDSNNQAVVLRGVNWYGAESNDFVVGGLQAKSLAAIVAQIKADGFNVVRLPWSDQMVETDPPVGDYALTANTWMNGAPALEIFDQVVNALTGAGIMVILDNHFSYAGWCCTLTDGNTLWYNKIFPESRWISDWQFMTMRYADDKMVIGADLRNEPRGAASWGGNPATDWHAAAERGGDAVLTVNPDLLIFVEGINFGTDLTGAGALPVNLRVPHKLVYEAHNYANDQQQFPNGEGFNSSFTANWGYLMTGKNPVPVYLGEFGTCNDKANCLDNNSPSDPGFWFQILLSYVQQKQMGWSYWPLNGTQSSGLGRGFGHKETYGILNTGWNGDASGELTALLEGVH